MDPLLSICIPTFNRAELLDHALDGLGELEQAGEPFEVVVSDNLSTDHTAEVVEKRRQSMPYLRYVRQGRSTPGYAGLINAVRNARGRYVVALADDDSLIADPLWGHVRRMEREPGLAAVYADWIAWDDEHAAEIHRYFDFTGPVSFGPGDPVGLVNFILGHVLYPEVAVYRRDALLRSDCLVRRGIYPFFLWAYRLSRIGRIAFEPVAFYREHRVVAPRFQRATSTNLAMRLEIVGDEFRNQFETIVLWALQDSGLSRVPDDQVLAVKQMIDRRLNARLMLEVMRAVEIADWLLALELRRRMVLWYGPGSMDEQQRDALQITFPAALQAIQEMYRTLTDVSGLVLDGFQSDKVREFFRFHYPDVRLIDRAGGAASDGGRPLVVSRDGTPDGGGDVAPDGYRLRLDHLLESYRLNTVRIDLAGL